MGPLCPTWRPGTRPVWHAAASSTRRIGSFEAPGRYGRPDPMPKPSPVPKPLVIVESKTKADTISRFLGPDYTVLASYGHVRDLPRKGLGVKVDDHFELTYAPPDGRAKEVVTKLRRALKDADELYLATDVFPRSARRSMRASSSSTDSASPTGATSTPRPACSIRPRAPVISARPMHDPWPSGFAGRPFWSKRSRHETSPTARSLRSRRPPSSRRPATSSVSAPVERCRSLRGCTSGASSPTCEPIR